jgi:hypothetical protein
MEVTNRMRAFLATTVLAAVSALAAGQSTIVVTVDGQPVMFQNGSPRMVHGRVLVPIRGVFEHMGASVEWHPEKNSVWVNDGAKSIELPIGSNQATVDGRTVYLDQPAVIYRGATLVPLRFLGEALGAHVKWDSQMYSVHITSVSAGTVPPGPEPGVRTVRLSPETVVPVRLRTMLSSKDSRVGDKFTAEIPVGPSDPDYGLPLGTTVEGHVSVQQAKSGTTPGVLGLEYDAIVLPDGTRTPVTASLIGLDEKSVRNENGRLVAINGSSNDAVKWVGIGAGAGALVALLTDGNVITNALIGGALGFIFNEIQKDANKSRDVTLKPGLDMGLRIDREVFLRVR